jgi:5-methylcytosine-specific restriction endonuclease McrA
MTAVAKRTSTRLCAEPGCRQVLVDALPGSRCTEHARAPWDRWRTGQPAEKSAGYGHRWRRFRQAIIDERGARCEDCGATDIRLELHHVDRQGMTGEHAYDPANVKLLCTSCHRRASRRRVA